MEIEISANLFFTITFVVLYTWNSKKMANVSKFYQMASPGKLISYSLFGLQAMLLLWKNNKKKSSLFVYKACCCFGIKNHILFLKPVMTEIQENHCDCAPLSQSSNTHAKPRRTLLEMSFLWANDFQRLQGFAVLLKIPVCASNLANFIIILFFIWPRRILKFPWVQNSWLKGLGIWRA